MAFNFLRKITARRATWLLVALAIVVAAVLVGMAILRAHRKYNFESTRRHGAPVPVRVTKAKLEEFPETIGANSLSEPSLTVDVKSQLSARVRAVYVDVGQIVSKGKKLVELDPTIFVTAVKTAEDGLVRSKTDLANSRLNLERNKVLFGQGVVAQVTLEEAALKLDNAQASYAKSQEDLVAAKYNLDHVVVTAPADGVVMKRPSSGSSQTVERIISPGEVVKDDEILLSLGDLRSIMVAANVPQEKLANVFLGQKAEVVFDTYRQTVLSGEVVKIDPQTNVVTRTFKVYVKLDRQPAPLPVVKGKTPGLPGASVDSGAKTKKDVTVAPTKAGAQPAVAQKTAPDPLPPGFKLTPGLAAYTRIFHNRQALTIPRLALIKNAGEATVFTVENSRAKIRRVRTGVELLHTVEVLSGLKEGEAVVYFGLIGLKENDLVNVDAQEKK